MLMHPRHTLLVDALLTLALGAGCHARLAGHRQSLADALSTPAWYVDPSDASGCADDANTCTQASCDGAGGGPCATWAEVHDVRWGCAAHGSGCPVLTQHTEAWFLSRPSGMRDPVILRPELVAASLSVHASPTVVASGTLGAVRPRDLRGGQLMAAALAPGLQRGQLVVNVTHPGAAFTKAPAAGLTSGWTLSQAFSAPSSPWMQMLSPPPEVDGQWLPGDGFVVYALGSVDLVELEPVITEYSADLTQGIFVDRVDVPNLSAQPIVTSPLRIGQGVLVAESSIHRDVWLDGAGSTAAGLNGTLFGDFFFRTVAGTAGTSNAACPLIVGGVIGNVGDAGGDQCGTSGGNAWCWDGDVVIDRNCYVTASGLTDVGTMFLDYGAALAPIEGITNLEAFMYGTQRVWGAGMVSVWGASVIGYQPGPGQAAATFLQTGAHASHPFYIDGQWQACSHSADPPQGGITQPTTPVDVISCGIPIDAQHLDAPQGPNGFGGWAFETTGGRITNVGL